MKTIKASTEVKHPFQKDKKITLDAIAAEAVIDFDDYFEALASKIHAQTNLTPAQEVAVVTIATQKLERICSELSTLNELEHDVKVVPVVSL
jgi:hypothetical protein